jgi:hypothetical protein
LQSTKQSTKMPYQTVMPKRSVKSKSGMDPK